MAHTLDIHRTARAPGRTAEAVGGRAERLADAAVHALGLVLATTGGAMLLARAAKRTDPTEYGALVIYVSALLIALAASCAYNLWPQSPLKRILRTVDHSMIFLLIAATYTPFIARMGEPGAIAIASGVWSAALAGILIKILRPARFERICVGLYLATGWGGIAAFPSMMAGLSATAVWLLIAGGAAFSVGVAFHLWRGLRFQIAIWHLFVLLGVALHYGAVLDSVMAG